MTLDLTDDEKLALAALLKRTIEDDRYPLSPLRPLKAILAKLEPPRAAAEPYPGALSRAEEERSSPAPDLCASQSVHGALPSLALPGAVEFPHWASTPQRQPNAPQDRAQWPTLSLADEISIPFFYAPAPCSDVP
jgi:hypothetical protein